MKKNLEVFTNIIDKKLNNGTFMVLIIGCIVTLSGFLTSGVNANLTADLMQGQKKTEITQYIIIEGKKYKIILEEVL
ncbi:MAG: hypothetical protein Q9M94_07235 [Candidatus Gracilibacteria bacterium]|nr:hypothetical protein [Candidatus Gracilibacteria bacterium]MDQ7022225.1 hypothetical protein [Candidatus Gracilibacteria bacterium]